LNARVVLAADGRRSVVARSLGLLREAHRPRRFAVRGHWEGVRGLLPVGEMHVRSGGGEYCGVAPLGEGVANVTFVLDQRDMRGAGGDLAAFYRRRLPEWPGVWERLTRARLRDTPRAIGPLCLESRRPWAPGVLLLGDAAGFFDPFTGEGIALALRGAAVASEVTLGALAAHLPLSVYEARHRALVREKFRFNRSVQWIIAHPGVANAAAHLLARLPAFADFAVDLAGDCRPRRRAEPQVRMASLLIRRGACGPGPTIEARPIHSGTPNGDRAGDTTVRR
jgi:flavin-dependent dehydrogenase